MSKLDPAAVSVREASSKGACRMTGTWQPKRKVTTYRVPRIGWEHNVN
jgi:hypothetical protein